MVQEYGKYTLADHYVWSLLYARQTKKIKEVAYNHFDKGIKLLHFDAERIPDFTQINKILDRLTGWQIFAVPGLIDNDYFFRRMSRKEFGVTTWIRKIEQLDYLEEPDMFHDVLGHIPLLTDTLICDFLHGLAMVALKHIDNEKIIEALSRLYWYTVEFGLVKEGDGIKIYGAGILSSIGETEYCLSASAKRIPFNLEQVLETPYIKDKYQEQYFVLDSMQQLRNILHELQKKFRQIVKL